jgi:hypothetical protein
VNETLAPNANDMETNENETLFKEQADSTGLGVKGAIETKAKA